MWEYALWSLALITGLSGLTMPQVISDQLYVIPNYTEEVATPDYEVSPDVQLPFKDTAVQKPVDALPQEPTQRIPQPADGADLADTGPQIGASAGVVIDANTGKILWQKNADEVRPIASMTKLMSMLVAAQLITDWDASHTFTAQEVGVGGSGFKAQAGEAFTRLDILRSALISSSNASALALSHATGLSDDEFTAMMQGEARRLGMEGAVFVEPTGLSAQNRASALGMAMLLREAARQPEIAAAISSAEHRMRPTNNEGKEVYMQNTNELLHNGTYGVIGGKTGFTYDAGYCLVNIMENSEGDRIITVVMGAEYEAQRFTETRELANWTYQHYDWR